MLHFNIKLLVFSILFIGIGIILVCNFVYPKTFRYGCVKCKRDYVYIKPCGINCTTYNYGFSYEGFVATYNFNCYTNNCELPIENDCEAIRFRRKYLSYVTDTTITTSNICNAIMICIVEIFIGGYIFSSTKSYVENSTKHIV